MMSCAAHVRAVAAAAVSLAVGAGITGCGLNVNLGDLFLITRTGQGRTLTLDVNDSGQVRCNGGRHRLLSSSQLITARDLADNLAPDATAKLTIAPVAGTVYFYRVKMQQGTIAFPDRAASAHRYLPEVELFTAQVAQDPCRFGG